VKRQTLILVVIGVVLFVAGGGIAFSTVVGGTKNAPPAAAAVSVNPVVVATANIPAGTTGEAMVAQGLVAIQAIPHAKYSASDLVSLSSLSDVALTQAVAKGAALEATQLTPSQSAISLPSGKDGVTVTVSGVAGLAGYLQPGSNVDVYADISKLSSIQSTSNVASTATNSGGVSLPCTELLMSDVEVLDVSNVVPALSPHVTSAGRVIPSSITILMAVSPVQARTITFMAENETLSVTQTQKGTTPPPVGQCIGTGAITAAS
jgi:Flp pilus assembly protein CpaB